jgi:polysaccharide export outer membrane protein
LAKVSQAPYILEPPDVVVLDAVRLTPRPPYRLEPQDVLEIHASESFPNQPIAGPYTVGFEGYIDLGYIYGSVRVAGLTLDQARAAISARLAKVQNKTYVSVQLRQFRGLFQVRGDHLIRPDGSISLGVYGEVYVTGKTLLQAKCAIENHLAQFMIDPDISLDVRAYNSKVYYVVTDCGAGEQIYIFPITGNETVLDAVGRVSGVPGLAGKKRIWVARPAPCGTDYCQILPVDWCAIVRCGATRTNYQLFPGDRVYIEADGWTRCNAALARMVAPLKSLLGIPLWENVVVHRDRCGQAP